MKSKILRSTLATVALVLGAASVIWAVVPPPPVNQTLGFYDTKFGALTQTECRQCHSGTPTQSADMHHALINSVVPAASCIRQPNQPANLVNGCHVLVSDGAGGFVFEDFRNCLKCHTTSPHHTTAAAMANDCVSCHGSLVENPGDHSIPAYPISSVTPLPGGRTVVIPGTTPTQTAIVQGCEACHQASPSASPPIFSNADTHHSTGIQNCNLCHNVAAGITIRQCEACHGVKSLHNIQTDTPAPANLGTIVPGAEELGYGHIGNNWDCNGCHWSWYGNSSPFTAATVPFISGQSILVAHVGQTTTLTLNGSSFTNEGFLNPVVTLTNGTNTVTLTPFSITVSEIKVLVPALLEGNYDMYVSKGVEGSSKVLSNLAKLTVVPEVTFKAAVLSSTTLTITGNNYGVAPSTQYNSGMGVFVGTKPARILSWSNSKIVASSRDFKAGSSVVVKSLYGSVSGTISGATKKSR